jgi:hypothetical protein
VADFQHYDFSVHFSLFNRSLAFGAKSGAKVLLFCELTKYLGKFFAYKLHFLCKSLIINMGILHFTT